jgi:hypothetical protein
MHLKHIVLVYGKDNANLKDLRVACHSAMSQIEALILIANTGDEKLSAMFQIEALILRANTGDEKLSAMSQIEALIQN